ncbi:MAG: hypothetical protein Q4G34_11040 [Micrococcus sp.]|nr:hypothetical protein [Micrococcus sp.]
MQIPSSRRLRLSLGAATLLVLTGCVTAPPELDEIWDQTVQSVREASSVRVSGDLPAPAVKADLEEAHVSLEGAVDDSSLRLLIGPGEGALEVVSVDGVAYLRPLDPAAQQPGTLAYAQIPEGQWVEVPDAADDVSVAQLHEQVLTALPDSLPEDPHVPATTVRVEGELLYRYGPLTTDDGTLTLDLDRSGRLRALTLTPPLGANADDAANTALTFSDWDAVEPLLAPRADEVYRAPGL